MTYELLAMTKNKPTAEEIERIMEPHKDRMRTWKIVRSTPVNQINWGWQTGTEEDGKRFVDEYPNLWILPEKGQKEPSVIWSNSLLRVLYETLRKLREGNTKYAPFYVIKMDGSWNAAGGREHIGDDIPRLTWNYVDAWCDIGWIFSFHDCFIMWHDDCWVTALECTSIWDAPTPAD